MKKNGLKLGFMSFFTKAVVHALKEVPAVNAQIDGDSVVVDLDDEKSGLSVTRAGALAD